MKTKKVSTVLRWQWAERPTSLPSQHLLFTIAGENFGGRLKLPSRREPD